MRRPGLDGDSIWLRSPQGHLVEIRARPRRSHRTSRPSSRRIRPLPPDSGHRPAQPGAPRVHPRRLSHVALYTPDVGGSIDFFRDVLGLRLSDRSLDIVAFMHGVHGSDHHMIALVTSPGRVSIIAAGTWAPFRTWDSALRRWRPAAMPRAGASAGTCSARITFTTCAIPGAATANIPQAWITCLAARIGRRPIHRRKTRCSCGDPAPPQDFVTNFEMG